MAVLVLCSPKVFFVRQVSGAPCCVCARTFEFGLITNVAATTTEEKCRNSDYAVETFLITCFCGLDVLIVVEFIFKDLNFIAKKKVLYIFLTFRYAEMINSSVCIYPPLVSLNVNSVEICDSVSSLLNLLNLLVGSLTGSHLINLLCSSNFSQFLILSGCTNLPLQNKLCKSENVCIFNVWKFLNFLLDNIYSL